MVIDEKERHMLQKVKYSSLVLFKFKFSNEY